MNTKCKKAECIRFFLRSTLWFTKLHASPWEVKTNEKRSEEEKNTSSLVCHHWLMLKSEVQRWPGWCSCHAVWCCAQIPWLFLGWEAEPWWDCTWANYGLRRGGLIKLSIRHQQLDRFPDLSWCFCVVWPLKHCHRWSSRDATPTCMLSWRALLGHSENFQKQLQSSAEVHRANISMGMVS